MKIRPVGAEKTEAPTRRS